MTVRTHTLQLPLRDEQVRALQVGDMVTLDGEVTVSIGLPTHRRMVADIEAGTPLPLDLHGGAFFHLSTYLREKPDGSLEALYTCPSTSTRYNAFMPTLIRGLGLKLVGGKGGLDAASVAAMRATGCAYLSFLGGGNTLLAEAIEGLVSSHWNEYISQFRLVTLKVRALGPATVGIDAHGNSIYASLQEQARQRRAAILEELHHQRQRFISTQRPLP